MPPLYHLSDRPARATHCLFDAGLLPFLYSQSVLTESQSETESASGVSQLWPSRAYGPGSPRSVRVLMKLTKSSYCR